MLEIVLKPRVKKFIQFLPPKHKRQVKDKALSLGENPMPHDAKKLKGYEHYYRVDVGEYRLVYAYPKPKQLVIILVAGKRNDGDVYRLAKRVLD